MTIKDASNWWLKVVLVILPFQYWISKNMILWGDKSLNVINSIDELTIVIFTPLAIIELYKNRNSLDWRVYFILFFSILFFCIAGLVSGAFNGNNYFISIVGTFDYIKNFLVIFIYAAFFKDFNEFNKIFRIVLAVAVLMGGVALIQELWAVVYRYILQKDISNSAMYIFRELPMTNSWRLGIYRTASLMYNPNLFGLYCVLFFVIYINMVKRIHYAVFIPLVTGAIVSVSRMVYTGFIAVLVFQIIKGRKWFLIFLIPALIFIMFMSLLWDFNIWKITNISDSSKIGMMLKNIETESPMVDNAISYRDYSYNKAMEVWKDHPIFGVGPGMFGGPISVMYSSHLYDEYNFEAKSFLENTTSLDQVWPQVFAETGIIGFFAFIGIFISLLISLISLKRYSTTNEVRGLLEGLMIYLIVILIYTFGSGLNLTALLFTYCAFAGMGLGYQRGQLCL